MLKVWFKLGAKKKKIPYDSGALQDKQAWTGFSVDLKVSLHGWGLWVPSLTLQHSVKPGFPLIFPHVSTTAQSLRPGSHGFRHSCRPHSTNKSPHQAATNDVLAPTPTMISWSLNTVPQMHLSSTAEGRRPTSHCQARYFIWFLPVSPRNPKGRNLTVTVLINYIRFTKKKKKSLTFSFSLLKQKASKNFIGPIYL